MMITFILVFIIIIFFFVCLELRTLIKGDEKKSCDPGPGEGCSLCGRKDGGCGGSNHK